MHNQQFFSVATQMGAEKGMRAKWKEPEGARKRKK